MKELVAMLEIKNLSKVLGERPVLRNLSLEVNKGEILAVTGPNGAGKSTLFKCAAGLMKPGGGKIFLDGRPVKRNSPEVKRKIGFLGHEPFLYPSLSAVENLRFYGKLYKVKDLDEKAFELLRKVGLHYFKDMPVHSFSRGMIQRLAIARVLLPEPEILLLDEPHTGLDRDGLALFNGILLEKKAEGAAILLITHDFSQVETLADRALLLKKGKITASMELRNPSGRISVGKWYEEAVNAG